jgi:hypothetical protein
MCNHFRFRETVPEGQNDLLAGHFLGNQTIQFVLRPVLREKCGGKDYNAEATSREAGVDLPPKTIADLEFELVIPHSQTFGNERASKWPHKCIFVLSGV